MNRRKRSRITGNRPEVHRPPIEECVDREIDTHITLLSENLIANGWEPQEALAEAQRRFGDSAIIRKECQTLVRRGDRRSFLTDLFRGLPHDMKIGVRSLVKKPEVSLMAILALGLGIGASTAIYSVINAVLLQPLPFDAADRVIAISEPGDTEDIASTSPANFLDWQSQANSFEVLAGYRTHIYSVSAEGDPERVYGINVSPGFFDVFGTKPLLGTVFHQDESFTDQADVAVLSYPLWQRLYGGSSDVIGQEIVLNDRTHTIMGVMPPEFIYPRDFEIWVRSYQYGVPEPPFTFDDQELREVRGLGYFRVVGRLKPAVTVEQADSEMGALAKNLLAEYPDSNCNNSAGVVLLQEVLFGDVRPGLIVLMLAVTFIVIIACANVANLLLARGMVREREIAIRGAIGASRGRLIRQLLTESILLAAAGGLAGVLLAVWGVDLLSSMGPEEIPRLDQASVNTSALLFGLTASLITGLLFGTLPSLSLAKTRIQSVLRESGPRISASRKQKFAREGLITSEVTLSMILLICSALLIRSMWELRQVDPGFDPQGVAVMRISLPENRYPEESQIAQFGTQLLERINSIPGVESSSIVTWLPMSGSAAELTISIEGRPELEDSEEMSSGYQIVTPGYRSLMKIPLLKGRDFTELDNENTLEVALINETFVRRFFLDEDPIDKRFTFGDPSDDETEWTTIVGIVGDVHHFQLDQAPLPEVYIPFAQDPWIYVSTVVRTTGEPSELLGPLRDAVREVDPAQTVYGLSTMNDVLINTYAQDRFLMHLLTLFAAVAALLATIGIFGVVSYSVNRRIREIGIRIALGARNREIVDMVLKQGMVPVYIGIGLGLFGAVIVTRLLDSLLYGVSRTDPVSFLGITIILTATAIIAMIRPAWRATQVHPVEALRQD